jgi:hypothetical protein
MVNTWLTHCGTWCLEPLFEKNLSEGKEEGLMQRKQRFKGSHEVTPQERLCFENNNFKGAFPIFTSCNAKQSCLLYLFPQP